MACSTRGAHENQVGVAQSRIGLRPACQRPSRVRRRCGWEAASTPCTRPRDAGFFSLPAAFSSLHRGTAADADLPFFGTQRRASSGIRAERGDPRMSLLTHDEQRTLMTLWSIARYVICGPGRTWAPYRIAAGLPGYFSDPGCARIRAIDRNPRQNAHRDGSRSWFERMYVHQ
jgi:hypothetical protein